MIVLGINIRVRIYKIACSQQVHSLENTDLISIIKTGINDRYLHPLPTKTCSVKTVPMMNSNLPPRIPIIVITLCHLIGHLFFTVGIAGRDTVGSCPHFPDSCHKRQCRHFINNRCVGYLHHHCIVPLTFGYRTYSFSDQHIYIALTYRKICRINGQSLPHATLQSTFGQISRRIVQCIGCFCLIAKVYTILIRFYLCRHL